MLTDGQHDLSTMIRTYAQNLQDQAEILQGLPGELAAENRAEAAAYLAVASDLERILVGELVMSGVRGEGAGAGAMAPQPA